MFVIFLVTACPTRANEVPLKYIPYKKALLACREGASEADITNSKRILNSDDAQVVIELSKCLHIDIAAARQFQAYRTNNESREEKRTLGYVAFIIIKRKVECLEPGHYHAITILNEENVKDWIDARKNLTLREMQLEAAKEGLNRAKKAYKIKKDEYLNDSLMEFQANIDAITSGHSPRFSTLME